MAEAATSKAISKITEQAIFLYGVDEQVRALVTELGRMRSFLKDVDSRKQTEQRVKNWAEEIRDLAEDAEGVVEKFSAEVKQRQGEDTAYCFCTMLANVVKEVIVRYKIGWDIGKINKRIKNLTTSLTTYGISHGINGGETSFREVILLSGAIGVERWGGSGGGHWSYRPKGLVKQIVVKHGSFIDSIMFKSIQENGVMESSQTFGGSGGHCMTEVTLSSFSLCCLLFKSVAGCVLDPSEVVHIFFEDPTRVQHHFKSAARCMLDPSKVAHFWGIRHGSI
ncbi:putative disease resistance protein At1g50180 isoform X2 [Lycium ferocissimum]|uniref:putative disease resistance protein At1g50180 isoform X2 n=1 Tax=Lycium ferocissimum TaxID=112874 RepID=UPI0028156ABB|nr:putative disease resistance protein At1g50180 isoform X2 [Lycium ferocissimum]